MTTTTGTGRRGAPRARSAHWCAAFVRLAPLPDARAAARPESGFAGLAAFGALRAAGKNLGAGPIDPGRGDPAGRPYGKGGGHAGHAQDARHVHPRAG